MKTELPNEHGLSDGSLRHLLFYQDGKPSLSDIQHQGLVAGVARDTSMLVVSPTSTGKTQLAVWAIAKGIENDCRTVYLVTHRALAKQKFDDFKSLFLSNFLSGNPASLVLATGDSVEDSEGEFPPEPLKASLLVATYEKYLAMLSASGVPRDMSNTVVVCDEIQLIGDKNRGQNVEILLTLLRNAGWRQFVGLSAVLPSRDAHDLADWLGVQLIMKATREKHLSYRTAFSVTLCHPGVDPSVAPVVAACGRLCVVESVDLGEALLRYCEGSLSNDQLYRWLATPGQALAADLPFVERV